MKGTNEVVLSTPEMIEALQYYFDKVMFREGYQTYITNVEAKKDNGYGPSGFTVTLQEAPKV